MLDVLSIKYNNIPMVVFKIIALDLLVIRHCRVNCSNKNFDESLYWHDLPLSNLRFTAL